MKKLFALLLAVVTVFALSACGSSSGGADLSDSKYIGAWECDALLLGDESETLGDSEFILTLEGDGTGTFYSLDAETGEEETSEITWELTDDGFKTKGDTKLTFTDDGDNIKTKIMGVDLSFVRSSDEEAADDGGDDGLEGNRIGYSGNDPAEYAVYKYMVDNIAPEYLEAQHSLAYGIVIDRDDSNADDVLIKGDFYVENYDLEDETLKFVSGGDHPGCFHLKTNEDGSFEVTSFDAVGDGSEFEPTAREIFGDKYDAFVEAYSDDDAKADLRYEAVTVFVNANAIPATQYQDEGWDPIELHL